MYKNLHIIHRNFTLILHYICPLPRKITLIWEISILLRLTYSRFTAIMYVVAILIFTASKIYNITKQENYMPLSPQSNVIKILSKSIPRKLVGIQLRLDESHKSVLRTMWNASNAVVPEFHNRLSVERYEPNGVLCEWIYHDRTRKKKILFYLHGGAYIKGGMSYVRSKSVRFAENTSTASVFAVDYRISAVAPFPAALDDSMAAYRFLTAELAAEDAEIIIMGDSAGGGLALAVMQMILSEGLKCPSCVILNSPWTDLTVSGSSIKEKAEADVVLDELFLKKSARLYAGKDLKNPLVSPLFADFTGFPPIYFEVGTDEILLDDSVRCAAAARAAGVKVNLHIWEGMYHLFHYWEDVAPESAAACKEMYDIIDGIYQPPKADPTD